MPSQLQWRCNFSLILLKFSSKILKGCSLPWITYLGPLPKVPGEDVIKYFKKGQSLPKLPASCFYCRAQLQTMKLFCFEHYNFFVSSLRNLKLYMDVSYACGLGTKDLDFLVRVLGMHGMSSIFELVLKIRNPLPSK